MNHEIESARSKAEKELAERRKKEAEEKVEKEKAARGRARREAAARKTAEAQEKVDALAGKKSRNEVTNETSEREKSHKAMENAALGFDAQNIRQVELEKPQAKETGNDLDSDLGLIRAPDRSTLAGVGKVSIFNGIGKPQLYYQYCNIDYKLLNNNCSIWDVQTYG